MRQGARTKGTNMGRIIALALSAVIMSSAVDARADGLAPLPPLDVSGWYLRGNIDDDAQQASEGQTYLQPNFLADLASGAARPARYSMSDER